MIAMKIDLVSVHKGQEFQLQRSKFREIQMLLENSRVGKAGRVVLRD